jgi:flagellar motility protein MotE (MotC chaperone)
VADDETTVEPDVADGTDTYYLDPAAPWAREVGAVTGGTRLEPAVVARVNLLFDESKGDLRHQEEYEAVWFPLDGSNLDIDSAITVDYDDRDLRSTAPEGARYVLPEAKINTKGYFSKARTELKDHLYRNELLELLKNPALKLISRVDETREEFAARCERAADDGADAEATKIREALEKKRDRLESAMAKAEDKVREIEHDSEARSRDAKLSGALVIAGAVLGGLLGGRRSTRGILGGVRRASSKSRTSNNAKERLASAERRLDEKIDDIEAIEEEITDSLYEIQGVWDDKAAAIEDFSVTFEKTDISVDEIALVWIPVEG